MLNIEILPLITINKEKITSLLNQFKQIALFNIYSKYKDLS